MKKINEKYKTLCNKKSKTKHRTYYQNWSIKPVKINELDQNVLSKTFELVSTLLIIFFYLSFSL